MTSLNESMLTDALALAQQQLQSFAQGENFWSVFNSVFGTQYDRTQAEAIQQAWQANDFSQLPEIQILDNTSMPGIQGGFSAQTGKIYINADFLANATADQIAAVLLEEIGHSLDSQVNTIDTPGDEGELFANRILGQSLTDEAVSRIQSENDTAVISINDQTASIEASINNVASIIASSSISLSALDAGWYTQYGFHDPNNQNTYTAYSSYHSFFVFSKPQIENIVGAKLSFYASVVSTGGAPQGTFNIRDVYTSTNSLIQGQAGTAGFIDLGDGSLLGTYNFDSSLSNRTFEVTLNGIGLAYINNATSTVVFGGSAIGEIFAFSNTYSNATLILNLDGATGAVTEDLNISNGQLNTAGKLAVIDADPGQAKFSTVVTSASGNLGNLSITEGGTWSYSVNNNLVQYLGAGATKIETFTVKSFDGSASQNINVTVTGVNDAPVISGTRPFESIYEDPLNNPGTLVSTLISGNVTDTDVGALQGIAVIGSIGTGWQYSTNNGSSWLNLGSVSNTNALLLTANTLVRFNPAANFNDTVILDYRAWDQTSGIAGTKVNITSTGGTTAFSAVAVGSGLNVLSVNDAPSGTDKTISTNEDTVYTFITADFGFSDPNDTPANSFSRVRITTLTGSGTLTNGSTAVSAGSFVTVADIQAGKLKFTPALNASGDSHTAFTFQVEDGGGTANGGVNLDPTPNTIIFNVTPVNDTPVVNQAIADQDATEDSAFSFTIPPNTFNDVDGDTLTYSATRADGSVLPSWLTFNTTTRTFSGTPENGDVGSLDIKIIATDGSGATAEDIFTLAIANTNDAPTLNATVASFPYTDTSDDNSFDAFEGTLTSTDPDIGDIPVYGVIGGTENTDGTISKTGIYGTLTVDQETGTYTFTPNDDAIESLKANAAEAFTLQVTDESGATATQTLTIDITGANDTANISGEINASLTEDSVISGALTVNGQLSVSDRDTGDAKFKTSVAPAVNALGSLTMSETGAWTYSVDNSAVQFLGQNNIRVETFTIESLDGTAQQEISITLQGVNDAPVGSATVTLSDGTEDTIYTINATDLLQGFSDVDGDTLSVSALAATHGTLTKKDDSTWSFKPDTNFNGTVDLSYNVVDGKGGSIAAAQSFTIAPVNDAPEVSNAIAAQNTLEDNLFTFTIPGDTFSDVDGNALTYSATLKDGKALPTWLSFDGTTFSGTPTNDQVGDLSIKVTATDGQLAVSNVFNLAIANTNDAPTADNDKLITNEDTPLVISVDTLLGNDIDVDLGDSLSVTEFTQPSQGRLVDNGNGTYTYTPNANYNGGDSFAYLIRDREGATSMATVNLTIQAINDNPDAIPDIVTARQGTAKTILAADLIANDADIEGDLLSLTQVKNAQNGTVALDSNGDVVFTANANVKMASFEYTISDSQGGIDTAVVSVLVGMTDDGGNGQDIMNGTAGDDVLNGGNGDDILFGFAGDDMLLGGNGMDQLQGAEGKDWLYGGRGNDLLKGGLGSDTFVLISQNGTDTIQDFTDGVDKIGLAEGLTFGQLTISSSNGNTLIGKNNSEVLAILSGTNSSLITEADFITIV